MAHRKRASFSDSPRGAYDKNFSMRFAASFAEDAGVAPPDENMLIMTDGTPFLLVDGGYILLAS